MGDFKYRNSASFGKRQEYMAVAELLRRGYDVYMTLVDDQGIDCVVRKGPRRYFEVQVKARSKDVKSHNAGIFPMLKIPEARPNYIFIFYSEMTVHDGRAGTYWVIPSTHIVRPGFSNVGGGRANKGRYRLVLANWQKKMGHPIPRPKYIKYVNAFRRVLGNPTAENNVER